MALQNVLVLCFSRETPYRFLETSHSTVFKQRFRECELLKDAPNSACRRLETVVLDIPDSCTNPQLRIYKPSKSFTRDIQFRCIRLAVRVKSLFHAHNKRRTIISN